MMSTPAALAEEMRRQVYALLEAVGANDNVKPAVKRLTTTLSTIRDVVESHKATTLPDRDATWLQDACEDARYAHSQFLKRARWQNPVPTTTNSSTKFPGPETLRALECIRWLTQDPRKPPNKFQFKVINPTKTSDQMKTLELGWEGVVRASIVVDGGEDSGTAVVIDVKMKPWSSSSLASCAHEQIAQEARRLLHHQYHHQTASLDVKLRTLVEFLKNRVYNVFLSPSSTVLVLDPQDGTLRVGLIDERR
jgi:hypothetical protein